MHEGWYHNQHFILFAPEEIGAATARYAVGSTLPEFVVVGIRGWDDLILRDVSGQLFTVPTVPLVQEYVAPFVGTPSPQSLQPDARVAGRIKWYVQPLVLGGSPELGENVTWVSHQQHGELVQWWNAKYAEVRSLGG